MTPNHFFVKREEKGVTFFTCGNIPFTHAFSTRLGGVSVLPHLASMNLGYGRGDTDETVSENYRRFLTATALAGAEEEPLSLCAMAHQIHSDKIRYVDCGGVYPDGDGFFTDCPHVILTAKVADCVPILLCDPKKKLIAALHAGWRGTVAGIAEKGVAALVALGACPEDIRAAVGASIHSCCYEVGEDFYESVSKTRSSAFADAHIFARESFGKTKLFADVAGMNRTLLIEAGVKADSIAMAGECTACRKDLFFSHRATGGQRGTMVAAIRLTQG